MVRIAIVSILVGIITLAAGIAIGRQSVDEGVPLLPTRIPATPENYLAQMNATPVIYFGTTIEGVHFRLGEVKRQPIKHQKYH